MCNNAKGTCKCPSIKCPQRLRPHQVEAVEDARRTFLRNPGDRATITITAPSASGKTQMYRIISDALKAHGVEVTDLRELPHLNSEVFDVVAPVPRLKTGRVVGMADGSAAIIVGGGESPTYDDLIEAGWIDPLTAPVGRAAQPSAAVEIPIGERAVEVVSTPCDGLTAQMQEAVAVCDSLAAELAMEPGEQDDICAKVNKALGGNAEKQLLELIQKVGLRNWFDGDFVVLSMGEARSVRDRLGPFSADAHVLDGAIAKARK